jgi:preprotein translocase subunit SecY
VILPNQPRRLILLSTYLAAGLTISVAIGLGIVLALKSSGTLRSERSGLSWTTDLAIGGLALLLAVALATRADARVAQRRKARAEKREPIPQRVLARGSVPIVLLASLAINLPGAAYLVALKDISAAHHSTAADIVLVLAFNAIMFLSPRSR